MIRSLDSLAIWLGDFYLLSTLLLAIVLAVGVALRQPAKRLAVIKATLVALAILAALCALPRYSVVHLRTAERSNTTSSVNPQATAFAAASNLSESTKWPTSTDAAPLPLAKPASDAETTSAVWKEFTWQHGLVVAYIAGAIGVFGWLVVGQLVATRLRRQAHPALAELTAMLEEVSTRGRVSPKLGLNESEDTAEVVSHTSSTTPLGTSFGETRQRVPKLFISDRVAAPVALGLVQPVILLPQGFAETESATRNPKSAIASILAHELAHIRNHDLVWLAASRALLVVLWAQPLYWLLRRRMRFDQETLADAAAAELTSRQHYAEQLVAWARTLSTRPLPMRLSPAVGLWEGASQLRQRVAMLVNANFAVLRVCSRRWRNSVAGITVLTTVGLSLITLQPTTRADEAPAALAQPTPTASPKTRREQPSKSATRPEPNSIIGRVVDEKKQPFASAEVFLFHINTLTSTRKLVDQTKSDAKGEFRFENVVDFAKELPGSKFALNDPNEHEFLQTVVRAPGRVTHFGTMSSRFIARFGRQENAELSPASKLSGHVTTTNGTPVAGALVSVGFAAVVPWEGAASARTNNNGYYEVNDVAPFDMHEYMEREAARRRQAEALRGGTSQADYLFLAPPTISVNHPAFAAKAVQYEKIPGTQNVVLEPAAIIEGRVIYGDTSKPAAGTIVHAATMRSLTTRLTEDQLTSLHQATVQTDANGNYRIATLPTGNYELSAEMPDWVNVGIENLAADGGKLTKSPDLALTKGGVVSVRLIDEKTGKALELRPGTAASIASHRYPLLVVSRPAWSPNVTPNSEGRFELRSPPGRRAIFVNGVKIGDEVKWVVKASVGEIKPPVVVDVQEGQSVEVDVPVVDVMEHAKEQITGSYQVAAELPPQDRIKQQTTILEKDPNNINALFVRAEAWLRLRNERNALADYEQLLKLNLQFPKNLSVYNNVAYILATSTEDNLRNGKRAVELAEKANRLLQRPSPDSLDTLAAAYAEAGDFERAIRTQKEAIDLAEDHRREQFREPLKLYESHKPRREKAK